MTTILAGTVAFTVVILLFVGALLLARARLIATGDVRLVVNDDDEHSFSAPVGATLLDALSARDVLVPSACGGQGSCGACKVRIPGGGAPLPTERAHLSRSEEQRGVRLACQFRLRENLHIELPAEVFGSQKWTCEVVSNRNVAPYIKELVLRLPEGESVSFRAGAYVQLQVPPHVANYRDFDIDPRFHADWDRVQLWRHVSRVTETAQRAYSMASAPAEQGILMLNVRIASPPPGQPDVPPGVASSYIFGLRAGDHVTVSGPYGDFFARESDAEMVFIGGGAGMAPMRSHIVDQLERLQSQRKISFWYGARSLHEAFYGDLFDRLAGAHPNFSWTLALSEPRAEDSWTGATGFVHQVALDNYLTSHPAPEELEYYLCGPPPMLAACRSALSDLGVDPNNILFDSFG